MKPTDLRPSTAEVKYLQLAYNYFYNIFDEVMTDAFWRKNKYYRFSKAKDAFSIYAELLNYEPIGWVIENMRKSRPPMEAEISSDLFKFIRNTVIHFSYFDKWDDVWIDKDIVNWYKEGQTMDKFLHKYEGKQSVKYRMWNPKKKEMTYLSINFPKNYTGGNKVFLKDILEEEKGIKFSMTFMRKVIDTQLEN